jgi:hypothetical protein
MKVDDLKFALRQSFKRIANGVDTERRKEVNQYLIETKLKEERNKRVYVQGKLKEDEQKEKIRKAELRRFNAEVRKQKKRLKDFKDAMLKKRNYSYGPPEFLNDQPFAVTTSQVEYKYLFSLEGDFLTRGTDIQFGKDGLVYTIDKLYDFHTLSHYDLQANKIEKLQLFFNLKDFKCKLYELDPEGMLGFKIEMYPHEKEEYRISKLTPEELLAEQKEKERKEEEKRKASRTPDDDFLDDLFKQ